MRLFSYFTNRSLQKRIDAATLLINDTHNNRFINRVKEKNPHWSQLTIATHIEEYKKFMYVAATSNEMCTPSRDVDIIWHEHILFTRDYISYWCGKILKKVIHHEPSKPGEENAFKSAYIQTKEKIRKEYKQHNRSSALANLVDVVDTTANLADILSEYHSGHSSHDNVSLCGSSGHSSCSSGSSCGSGCGGGGD